MGCDLCGAEGELLRVRVEGVEMRACRSCSAFGKVITESRPAPTTTRQTIAPRARYEEPEEVVVEDYHQRIKQARERRGFKQKELAKALALKESMLHKVESGHFRPSIEMARRIERHLGISLVTTMQTPLTGGASPLDDGAPLTLGDVIELRRR